MQKLRMAGIGAAGLLAASLIGAPGSQAAEGCMAVAPAGSTKLATCEYTASGNGYIMAASNNWKVTITRAGSAPIVEKGTAPAYVASSTAKIKKGDKVKVEVAAGWVGVGSLTEGPGYTPPKP